MQSTVHSHHDYQAVNSLLACIYADFHGPVSNPFFPISTTDERGVFYGLEFTDTQPFLVEVLHSAAGSVRGNHIHRHCTELLTVLSGELDIYLLCTCPEKHLYKKQLSAGMSVSIYPGIAHAIHSQTPTECIVVFCDNDPRQDREYVQLLLQV